MTSDGEEQIIRLLTELRDAQREDLAYRRQVLEQSLGLQKRTVRFQRVGIAIVLLLALGIVVLILIASR